MAPRFNAQLGGIDNMPAFMAYLGRRFKVSALVDGHQRAHMWIA